MRIAICILYLSAIALCSFQEYCGGIERWPVKTMQDKDAGMVNMRTINTTVNRLRQKKSLVKIIGTTPRQIDEMQTYTVDCYINKYILEPDGDYHLVISDPKTGETMIAEIPNPLCDRVQGSKYISYFSRSRSEFLKYAKGGKCLGLFRIKGCLFFDKAHSIAPIGDAPFHAEIHPVLTFKKIN